MAEPIVIAHHLIWTAYGWWLPNDPRDSGSQQLRNNIFGELGALHFGRKRVQPAGTEVRGFYDKARNVLRFELRTFSPKERRLIGEVFGHVIAAERYTCYACVVMPDHVHLLLRKHRHTAE